MSDETPDVWGDDEVAAIHETYAVAESIEGLAEGLAEGDHDDILDRLVRRRIHHQRKIDRLDASFESARLDLAEREEAVIGPHRHMVESVDRALRDVMRMIAKQSGAKSLVLPSGTIRTRKGQPRLVVDDQVAVFEWAEDTEDYADRFINKQWSVAKAELKKHITTSGESVPGVHIEHGDMSVKVVEP